eukprot:scaffold252020_cov28-Tisochrysis_lutea.AAC.3
MGCGVIVEASSARITSEAAAFSHGESMKDASIIGRVAPAAFGQGWCSNTLSPSTSSADSNGLRPDPCRLPHTPCSSDTLVGACTSDVETPSNHVELGVADGASPKGKRLLGAAAAGWTAHSDDVPH